MVVDWVIVLPILAALGGWSLGLIHTAVNRRWLKQDRELDRLEARRDKHRDERRQAIADYITAATHAIFSGGLGRIHLAAGS